MSTTFLRPGHLHTSSRILSASSESGLTVAPPIPGTANKGALRLRGSGTPLVVSNFVVQLLTGGNTLLLDEPTNDLDVDTLRALEDALLAFPGCAVVISHDRWFLDRICTHVLAFEGDSVVRWFEGNFSDYEADRHRRLGKDADQPHRIKFKPLAKR